MLQFTNPPLITADTASAVARTTDTGFAARLASLPAPTRSARYRLAEEGAAEETHRCPLRHCDLLATRKPTKEKVDASCQYATSE
jgi:hypothetical protein